MLDLTGRVAIVTGGGTGIGAATARLLARQGADVAIAARTLEDLERTAAAVEQDSGRRCLTVPASAEPGPDPRQRFTHIELGPATTQATILRDLVLGATPSCGIAPASFADGVACVEVLDAIRRSAADGGRLVKVGQ